MARVLVNPIWHGKAGPASDALPPVGRSRGMPRKPPRLSRRMLWRVRTAPPPHHGKLRAVGNRRAARRSTPAAGREAREDRDGPGPAADAQARRAGRGAAGRRGRARRAAPRAHVRLAGTTSGRRRRRGGCTCSGGSTPQVGRVPAGALSDRIGTPPGVRPGTGRGPPPFRAPLSFAEPLSVAATAPVALMRSPRRALNRGRCRQHARRLLLLRPRGSALGRRRRGRPGARGTILRGNGGGGQRRLRERRGGALRCLEGWAGGRDASCCAKGGAWVRGAGGNY